MFVYLVVFLYLIAEVTQLQRRDLILQKAIRSYVILEKCLNTYEQNGNHFYFCQSCINEIQKCKTLQFGYINSITHVFIVAILKYSETLH